MQFFGFGPESVILINAQYFLRPLKTSSASSSSSAQCHPRPLHLRLIVLGRWLTTQPLLIPKSRPSPTQRSRSPTNPLWPSHKSPSRSVLSQLKRGGSKSVMPSAIFVFLRRPPLPPPRVWVRMPFPLLQVPSEFKNHPSRLRSSVLFNFLVYHRRINNRKYRTLAKFRAAFSCLFRTFKD